MAEQPLRIGITIGLQEETESLWVNGIKQNAIYLAKLFQQSARHHRVTLVNTTAVRITPMLPWDTTQYPVKSFEDVKDDLDLLIELGGQINESQTRYLRSRDTRLVSYCCGPEYVQRMEAMIFGRSLGNRVFINQEYDAIWVIPQIVETSSHFFGTLRRRPVKEVPFVWDPMFIDAITAGFSDNGEYRPRTQSKRISIMEPNIDVLKFCLYPILIAEEVYRADPERIGHVHVTNAAHLASENGEFAGTMHYLDLVKDHKISFVGRYTTPAFLAEHTDIVISHQWGLALNYFYLEVCWKGYPLVHNAHLCKDLGYYYCGNDVNEGARQVHEATHRHDKDFVEYRHRQQELISRFTPASSALVEAYDSLLDELMLSADALV
ncbi:DUF2827 domain-containing protein [Paraburkholderia silviterrae]|uniref:DUF2827 domain-containing protein n=1 Tax=Paraburkholderia silviterrae TaxID=2528715 RepID=A0A4R5LY53_9BURK|nr:DUF2827 domain-containing protein [Paraburkholderia silviterrae]TDG17232.1 DUF2827 domain-containing protein [Paraburkholderia silviterrae]